MDRWWSTLSVIVAFLVIVHCDEQETRQCTTPNGTVGRCVPVRACAYVLDILRKKHFSQNDTLYLEGLVCGTLPNGFSLVCCPRLINEPGCGPSKTRVRIIGGNDTEIGEYPWMALLRFTDRRNKISTNCAGSLISRRFVLTAAHCITLAKKEGKKIHSVRVAEWNFMNHRGSKDCKHVKDHVEPICRKDYGVMHVAIHPHYTINRLVQVNDIALIKLVNEVQYNDFVAPICLPLDEVHLPPADFDTEYTAAGWGSIDPTSDKMSPEMKQVNLHYFEKNRCRKIYHVPNDNGVGIGHICAGGLDNEDTCRGDSGGPLMESFELVWYLAGVTSFGWTKCGRVGMPGVYTNVSHYQSWLEREVFRDTRA